MSYKLPAKLSKALTKKVNKKLGPNVNLFPLPAVGPFKAAMEPTFEDIVRSKILNIGDYSQPWQSQIETIQYLCNILGKYNGNNLDVHQIERLVFLIQDLSKELDGAAKELEKLQKELIISDVLK